MRVRVSDHQHKSLVLVDTLWRRGHHIVDDDYDCLLIDCDVTDWYKRQIEHAVSIGAKVFMYSHGAMPLIGWDGIWEPSPQIDAALMMTPGQAEVMRRYGYPHPVNVIGWHYCAQSPFTPTDGRRVLFAPRHPQSTGWLLPEGRKANTNTFCRLARAFDAENITVRHVHALDHNGIPSAYGVNYQPSDMTTTGAIRAINGADLVVAYGTLAYLAIALGKPTIMFGMDGTPSDGHNPANLRYAASYDLYREYMHYPYTMADDIGADEFRELVQTALTQEAAEWRATFIGEQFEPARFVKLLEQLTYADLPVH